MATQTTQGSGVVNNNGGAVLHGGSTTLLRNNTAIVSSYKSYNWGLPVPNPVGGFRSVQLGTGVAITDIKESGSTGYVQIHKASHGLALNDLLVVYAASVAGYNTVHRVTVVTDGDNVQTDVLYTADTSVTHGSYKPFSGLFNTMTERAYIGTIIGKDTTGTSIASLRLVAADSGSTRRAIALAVSNYRYQITSWNAVTGAATKGANDGDAYTFIDPVSGSAAVEAKPTRAVPGEFVYTIGTNVPTQANYSARTE